MPKEARAAAGEGGGSVSDIKYIYRWDRQGRKGQRCNVLARGTMNSCLLIFEDGYRMVTSRNAIRKNKLGVTPL